MINNLVDIGSDRIDYYNISCGNTSHMKRNCEMIFFEVLLTLKVFCFCMLKIFPAEEDKSSSVSNKRALSAHAFEDSKSATEVNP